MSRVQPGRPSGATDPSAAGEPDASRAGRSAESTAGRALVVVGIVLLAVNLRPAATSIGPVLAEIRQGLGMSGAEAGLLTSLPVLTFAVIGALAPRLAHLLGPHRLTAVALAAALLGIVTRSLAPNQPVFLVLSLLALAGMATANVVLPSLVKRHFPDRIGLMTAVYSTAMACGVTLSSALTVPISQSLGGWRIGLATWGITAAIALLPWLVLAREDRRGPQAPDADEPGTEVISISRVARTRLGWLMAGFFGLQALQAYAVFGWFANIYRDLGASATTAGLLLAVATGIAIPLSFAIPTLTARLTNPLPLLLVLVACYFVGYGGILLAPWAAPVVWAGFVGIGTTTFPMVLTMIGLRADTAAGTAALSGFAQSVGYLAAAIGPFGLGVLHDLTGGWTVPMVVLLVLALPLALLGSLVLRSSQLEDQLHL